MHLLLWDELLVLWQSGDFRSVHDWINERWACVVQESVEADSDPFARFLQGLAFAALAFHFAGEQNRESAELFVEDSLDVLSRYPSTYAGIDTTPIIDALAELRNLMPAPDAGQPIPEIISSVRALRFLSGALA
jgi:hypothetical protein